MEDLKGKKVGIAVFGSGLEVYTQVILKEHGLSPDDVTFIANSTHQAAYASLETGQVDATIIHEPFALSRRRREKAISSLQAGITCRPSTPVCWRRATVFWKRNRNWSRSCCELTSNRRSMRRAIRTSLRLTI